MKPGVRFRVDPGVGFRFDPSITNGRGCKSKPQIFLTNFSRILIVLIFPPPAVPQNIRNAFGHPCCMSVPGPKIHLELTYKGPPDVKCNFQTFCILAGTLHVNPKVKLQKRFLSRVGLNPVNVSRLSNPWPKSVQQSAPKNVVNFAPNSRCQISPKVVFGMRF